MRHILTAASVYVLEVEVEYFKTSLDFFPLEFSGFMPTSNFTSRMTHFLDESFIEQ